MERILTFSYRYLFLIPTLKEIIIIDVDCVPLNERIPSVVDCSIEFATELFDWIQKFFTSLLVSAKRAQHGRCDGFAIDSLHSPHDHAHVSGIDKCIHYSFQVKVIHTNRIAVDSHSLNDDTNTVWFDGFCDSQSDFFGQAFLHLHSSREYLHNSGKSI